jgi:hypothetical protein
MERNKTFIDLRIIERGIGCFQYHPEDEFGNREEFVNGRLWLPADLHDGIWDQSRLRHSGAVIELAFGPVESMGLPKRWNTQENHKAWISCAAIWFEHLSEGVEEDDKQDVWSAVVRTLSRSAAPA